MRSFRTVGVFGLCLVAIGCAESTIIRSNPPGARVSINGRLEGTTPMTFTVSRSQFADQAFQARLERQGYEPFEATLHKQVCGGRVVGGIFSLGISFIFKRPSCFSDPQTFSLTPLAGEPPERPLSIQERLERLQKMRENGTITEEEYQHSRKEVLKGL